ncbi:MAG: Rne/Rng family ribonuclease [Candidatus Omnitrophica bacterium]|nr:Rne/Rng family ribonuclease [Candidatus Omnitrophota bacterium]
MKRTILISQEANEKRIAILEDGRLEEFYIERAETARQFGNIYKARVKSVVKGMDAAFVDLGTGKDGFLYVGDSLSSPFSDEIGIDPEDIKRKNVNIEDVLRAGQEIIVQVVKEAIRNKGPRLTTHISLPARYLVLMPGHERFGISRKIADRNERDRIKEIFADIEIPDGVGFIVRTAGEGKTKKEFLRDIRYLLNQWRNIEGMQKRSRAPALIHTEPDLIERMIRDSFKEGQDKLIVDKRELFKQIQQFMKSYLPGYEPELDLYRENESLFAHHRIDEEIANTFQRMVPLKSGGSIVIEQTESLVAIDVNTGKFTGSNNLEHTVFQTNIEASKEIARQLRLRDVGGIVIIDFIDMENYQNRREVYRALRTELSKDRARTNILPISEIGLVEMTRQRVRPSVASSVFNSCPYCRGKGTVKSITTMGIEILREIRRRLAGNAHKEIQAVAHPAVVEHLLKRERQSIRNFERQFRSRIRLIGDAALHVEEQQIKVEERRRGFLFRTPFSRRPHKQEQTEHTQQAANTV